MKVYQPTANDIAGVIDHTFLKNHDHGLDITEQKKCVSKLIAQAIEFKAYSICIRENLVEFASSQIQELKENNHDSNKIWPKICSVIGFPDGDQLSSREKKDMALEAITQGADEIDMVIPVRALKQRKLDYVYQDILILSQTVGAKVLKVIFENFYLTEGEKWVVSAIVKQAFLDSYRSDHQGARFFKTSTGFADLDKASFPVPNEKAPIGACLQDIELMFMVGHGEIGIKPSGGIKNLEEAIAFYKASGSPQMKQGTSMKIDPSRFRIGSSSLLLNLFQ